MTSPSSSLFLSLLLLSHLFTYQTHAIRPLQGSDIKRKRETSVDLTDQLSVEGGDDDDDHIQRKEFHEVHSGPNPISNSIPRGWRKTKLERNP